MRAKFQLIQKKFEIRFWKLFRGLSLEAKLIWTLALVEISLGKESCLGGSKGKLWQLINSCYQLMKFFDIMDEKIHSWKLFRGLSLEAKLIWTLALVEISLGKEPDLAGSEGKVWQLIIFFENMNEKMSSWLVCNQSFMKLGWSEPWF